MHCLSSAAIQCIKMMENYTGTHFLDSYLMNREQSCLSPRENISMQKVKQENLVTEESQNITYATLEEHPLAM